MRAPFPQADVQDQIVIIRFKTLHALLCDAERKFLEACAKYIELSQMVASGLINEESILKSLENAVTCAILAKAGPSRSRLFATLFRDERSARLPNYRILEKMFKERILRASEVAKFEETLQPHQRATLAGGVTVLKAAVNEHNSTCGQTRACFLNQLDCCECVTDECLSMLLHMKRSVGCFKDISQHQIRRARCAARSDTRPSRAGMQCANLALCNQCTVSAPSDSPFSL